MSEYGSQLAGMKVSKKSKRNKVTTVTVLQPTGREKNMAGAYGGQAIGQIKRPGVKYDKDRLKESKKFRVNTEDEPALRAQLSHLVKSGSRKEISQGSGSRKGSITGNEISRSRLIAGAIDSQSQGSGRKMFDQQPRRKQPKL